MEAMNEKTNWVVAAAIKNGLVACRCSPSGELKKITDEEWACKMGTKRIPSDWLERGIHGCRMEFHQYQTSA